MQQPTGLFPGDPTFLHPTKIAQERVFLLPEFCHLTGLDEDTSHHKTRCFDEIFVAGR